MKYKDEIEQIKQMSVEQMQLYILDKMIMDNYAGNDWADHDHDAWDEYQWDTHHAGACGGGCVCCEYIYENEECCIMVNPFTGEVSGADDCPCEECVEERDEE